MLTTDDLARLREHAVWTPPAYTVEDQPAVNAVWDALPELLRVYEAVLAATEVNITWEAPEGRPPYWTIHSEREGAASIDAMADTDAAVRLVPLATAKGGEHG